MKNNPSGVIPLYGATRDYSFAIRIQFPLKEPIDADLLRESVEFARPRFPYFFVRLEPDADSKTLRLVPNDAPLAIIEGLDPTCLFTSQTNFHAQAIRYQGCSFYIDIAHAFCDGTGLLRYVRTVMYHYIATKYGVSLDPTDVRMPGEPIPPEETTDPYLSYLNNLPADVDAFPLSEEEPFSFRRDGAIPLDRTPTYFEVTIPETAFVRYSKSVDGSPATMSAVFLAKAIFALNPDTDKTVRVAIPINDRGFLGSQNAHHNLAPNLYLRYPPKIKDRPIDRLATISRGTVILQSTPEERLAETNRICRLAKEVLDAGSIRESKRIAAEMTARESRRCTFFSSYVGKLDWGDLGEYLNGVYVFLNTAQTDIVLETQAVAGNFQITFMQSFSNPDYILKFAELLQAEQIPCTVSEPKPLIVPIIDLED